MDRRPHKRRTPDEMAADAMLATFSPPSPVAGLLGPALRSTMTTTTKKKPAAVKPTKSAKSAKSAKPAARTYTDAENEKEWREICAEMGEDPNERD